MDISHLKKFFRFIEVGGRKVLQIATRVEVEGDEFVPYDWEDVRYEPKP